MAIGKGSSGVIDAADAHKHVFGYAVGIDLTRRDLQTAAKQAGRPWDAAKGFDRSAPLSAIVRATHLDDTTQLTLRVNNEVRQEGTIDQMIWSVSEIIHKCSELFDLQPGDLIFTGTPAGVGSLVPGDAVHAHVVGSQWKVELAFRV